MECVVTGVAGFIGSNLARQLLALGHIVVGIDSLTDYYDVTLKHANLETLVGPDFTFIEKSLQTCDLPRVLSTADFVFHEAGQPGVRASWGSEFDLYLQSNVLATQHLLEAAVDAPRLKRIVYASSSSIYGETPTFPTLETAQPRPLSPYGVTKLAAEHLCTLYAKNYSVPTVALRYFTVYGPGQRPDMAFTRFARAAVTGDKVTIFGDGNQIRDFTFIDDVVAANIACMETEVPGGTVLNVAGGSSASVNEVLEVIDRLNGQSVLRNYVAPVKGDVPRTGADTHAIHAALGWSPRVSLEEGLSRQFDWARSVFA